MNNLIFNPLQEFESKYKQLHCDNTSKFFENLVSKSAVNIDENRETVKQYNLFKDNLSKLSKKCTLFKILRVIMCITVLLIPLVILKITPIIKQLRTDIELADKKAAELLDLAYKQMLALNQLFTDRDALNLIEETMPLAVFEPYLSAEQELDMMLNYDFSKAGDDEQSTIDVLAGRYNENPFVFENKIVHTMGSETYHGYKTIHWTESYVDGNGKSRTRTRSQTLHATVTKPKPFYNTQVVLNYGAQGAPDLIFSRDASHLERKSDRALEHHIKKGERKIKRLSDKALKDNRDFTSMANTDFEVLFDALDRNDEVGFRTLFTPLAQTNLVELILSKSGYGDDFNFFKTKRMNKIITTHSQGREINIKAAAYMSYDFDVIKQNFNNKNNDFFKAVYFDFAPLLAIPMYQERPVHSLKPIPENDRIFSYKECEALANMIDKSCLVHPKTKTQAILKTEFMGLNNNVEKTSITAYSYDIIQRVDVVSVYGGDGRYHNVSVNWDDYIPVSQQNEYFVSKRNEASGVNVAAERNDICIFK